MTEIKEYKKLEQLVQQIDPQSELLRTRELKGGVSAQVTALEILLSDGQIRDALEAVWPLPQRNQSVLLHGDFWPGNTL